MSKEGGRGGREGGGGCLFYTVTEHISWEIGLSKSLTGVDRKIDRQTNIYVDKQIIEDKSHGSRATMREGRGARGGQ